MQKKKSARDDKCNLRQCADKSFSSVIHFRKLFHYVKYIPREITGFIQPSDGQYTIYTLISGTDEQAEIK